MKRILPWLLLPAIAIAAIPSANAASPGGRCAKIDAKFKSGTTNLVCLKVGKKLIWQVAPTPTPTPTLSPKPTVSASATPSPKPTATVDTPAAIAEQSKYEITVNARSFSWAFKYQVANEKTQRSGVEPILYLPVGKPIQLNIAALDGSHGFWVPGLSISQETDPNSTAHLNLNLTKEGKYTGACDIQCGRGHAEMTFSVEVISEANYLKYLATIK